MFREPVHQVLDKIKNEPYFKWPNKIGEDPRGATKDFIAITIRSEDIPPKTVELYGITWNSWFKMGDYNSFLST